MMQRLELRATYESAVVNNGLLSHWEELAVMYPSSYGCIQQHPVGEVIPAVPVKTP